MAARVQTSYVAVRGEVDRNELSFVFGLTEDAETYLKIYFEACSRPGESIHHFHGTAMKVIDALCDMGYHVVVRTYDGPMSTWILERHETSCGCTCHKPEVVDDDTEPSAGPSWME